MKINELDLSHVVGDFGAAALKQAGNRIMGKPEGQMSVKDKMAHDMFIRDFIGRAKADLNAAVNSGLVDVATTQSNPAQSTTAPSVQQDTQQATPTTQQATQQNTTVAPSPEEIRKQKQAIAATDANKQAAPFSKVTPSPAVWKDNRNPDNPASRNPIKPMKEDEAAVGQKMSIAQYVKNMFAKYMKKTNIKSPQVQQQLNALAQEVQSTYGSGAKEALTKLANLAYSVSYADINGDGVPDNAAVPQKTGALDAISAGLKQGLSGTQSASNTPTAPSTQGTTYKQVVDLIKTLDKKGKQKALTYVQQKLGNTTSTPKKQPSAISNMARQLSTLGQQNTSTGGTQVPTGTGIKNTASITNLNQASKIDAMKTRAKAVRNRKKEAPASE